MYQVTRNNRVLKSVGTMFDSYERARQALRKYIRKQVTKGKLDKNLFHGSFGWDSYSRNPVAFSHAGYSIRKAS